MAPPSPVPAAVMGEQARSAVRPSSAEESVGDRPAIHSKLSPGSENVRWDGETGYAWTIALKTLLGVTAQGPHLPHFVWGLRDSRRTWGDLSILSRRFRTDIVFVEFIEPSSAEPPTLVLAEYGRQGVTVFEDCELWVLNTWRNFEILTPRRRFKLDDAGRLVGRANNLDEMRARRVTAAHRRWADLAAELSANPAGPYSPIPADHFDSEPLLAEKAGGPASPS